MSDAPACSVRVAPAPLFDIGSFDLAAACIIEINVGLNEFDLKKAGLSHRYESWPDAIRKRMEDEIAKWAQSKPAAKILLVSTAIHNGVAVLILHFTLP